MWRLNSAQIHNLIMFIYLLFGENGICYNGKNSLFGTWNSGNSREELKKSAKSSIVIEWSQIWGSWFRPEFSLSITHWSWSGISWDLVFLAKSFFISAAYLGNPISTILVVQVFLDKKFALLRIRKLHKPWKKITNFKVKKSQAPSQMFLINSRNHARLEWSEEHLEVEHIRQRVICCTGTSIWRTFR